MILEFPKHHHARTFKGTRAANVISVLDVTRARRARRVATTVDHQTSGMWSRCHHLLTCEEVAPVSVAISSLEGHSSITDRKESILDIDSVLGRNVVKDKANLSCDCEDQGGDNGRMAESISETEARMAFVRRTKAAREARFEKQKPILTILGLTQGTYKQYESRTPLPHRFIPKFCAATGVDIDWLLTGEGKGPAIAAVPKPTRRTARAPGKAA